MTDQPRQPLPPDIDVLTVLSRTTLRQKLVDNEGNFRVNDPDFWRGVIVGVQQREANALESIAKSLEKIVEALEGKAVSVGAGQAKAPANTVRKKPAKKASPRRSTAKK